MLLKADASQLEWRTKVFLSQDPVGMKEISEGYPIHDDNQVSFGLPTRTVAKVFLYRAIFADAFGDQGFSGPAFAYARDSDFAGTSTSTRFWEAVIEKFYSKYKGIYSHSIELIREATTTGRIISPSGRVYLYTPVTTYHGLDWPRTQILNHIVQGLAADFVQLARLILSYRLKQNGYKVLLINTVHDDIEIDLDNDKNLCYNISQEMREAFQDIPKAFNKHYGKQVNIPLDAEVKMGWNLHEDSMIKFNEETFDRDWETLNGN